MGKLQAEVPAGAAGRRPRDATALPTGALHRGLWDTALPALPLPAGKGDGLPCCPTEGFAGHYVASKLSKCSNSGRLPRGISQPRRDLQTLAGSGIILVLMTQA